MRHLRGGGHRRRGVGRGRGAFRGRGGCRGRRGVGITAGGKHRSRAEQRRGGEQSQGGFLICHDDLLNYGLVVVVVWLLDEVGGAGDFVVVVEVLSLPEP